ncbi:EF-P 5-aminopentanol modification-associated protein YfmF [uncultured Flavonifractor sp.]|uniref:EF-P 5-aminopentanol modification-associated protein YfmF n=1 Tax=uncultured Flavonifractor sp. TaxID=1193534 RepID=UPI00261283FF|nr:insulinase family protein [uncultured Flavonifractor sp.]
MKVTQITLRPGVHLTAVQTRKFKSSMLGAAFLAPLTEGEAALNALVPMVLRRGTAEHPDLESLSAALDELYGGTLEPMVRKKGETQCVGFVGSFLDDAYTLAGERVLEPAAELLAELLLRPYTQDGAFCPDYTRQERGNLIDRIKAQVNDKRQYAQLRVVAEMCGEEPFGVDRLGSEAAARDIDAALLWAQYQKLLRSARVELYYCGSAAPERVQAAFAPVVEGLPREGERMALVRPAKRAAPRKPRRVEEQLDVTQGKLAMGFRTNADAWDGQYPALALVNAIYGGTTTSKLFLNVRERLSLCYYASSGLMKYKDVMLVSSGVEFDKVGQAEGEILSQLYKCQTGDFSDDELEWARRSVVSTLLTTLDAQSRLEDYWLGQAAAGLTEGPDQLAARVEQVTREEAVAAAQDLILDTVYFLKGRD